jgi:predicted permease
MRFLARVRSFWRNVIHRKELEGGISEELQFHLERRAEDLIERRGLLPAEARRIARLEFGPVEKYKEEARESLSLKLVDEARGDLRYGFRSLARNKAFALAALGTLALGIGANTAIFSLMDAILVRQLPVERPDELVMLLRHVPGREPGNGFTNALWEAIRDNQKALSGVFAWSTGAPPFELMESGTARSVEGVMVSGDYFKTLGVSSAAGRLIAAADDHRGCPPVAVLSHGFWQTHLGANERALGSTVTLNRQPFQIVGVSAAGFHGMEVGKKFDVAVPICASARFDKRYVESTGRFWLSVAGRVTPGMREEQMKAAFDTLAPAVMAAGQQDVKARLVTAPAATGSSRLRRRFGGPLRLLMAGVALVLLVGCANIASLLLARAVTRAREMSIRTALGASRARLVRQLLTESLLLSSLGAVLGLLFARLGSAALAQSLATMRNSVFIDASLDGRVLGFTAFVATATGILVGLLPALRATSSSLIAAMKSRQAAGNDQRSRFHPGKWIVSGQVALSLVLLIGGGLLLNTFVKLLTLDAGFDRGNVLVVTARPPWFAAEATKSTPEQRWATYEEIGRRLRMVLGVVSVARAFTTPIGFDNYVTVISADAPNAPAGERATASFNFVRPGYFATLRTPLLSGRDLEERDERSAAPVAVANEALARQFFPGVNALGRTFRWRGQAAPVEIVGIVKDSKYGSLREAPPPTVFLPASSAPGNAEAAEFAVRTSTSPAALVPAIERVMADVNKGFPLEFHTLAAQVADNLVQERLLASLSAFFGALALLLAMVGLYGVLSYLVTNREAEFGIRMALGADRASILRLVMADVGLIVSGGVCLGLFVALASVQLMQGMLFGLEARDPLTIATAVCLLSAMALVAGFIPARRATRVDPMTALRAE